MPDSMNISSNDLMLTSKNTSMHVLQQNTHKKSQQQENSYQMIMIGKSSQHQPNNDIYEQLGTYVGNNENRTEAKKHNTSTSIHQKTKEGKNMQSQSNLTKLNNGKNSPF